MKRMSDEKAKLAEEMGRTNTWGREMRLAVLDDWAAARRAEKEKDEEIERLRKEVEERLGEMNLQAMWTLEAKQESARKDAVINALADALERYDPDGDVMGCGCCALSDAVGAAQEARIAALRLAGRLK